VGFRLSLIFMTTRRRGAGVEAVVRRIFFLFDGEMKMRYRGMDDAGRGGGILGMIFWKGKELRAA